MSNRSKAIEAIMKSLTSYNYREEVLVIKGKTQIELALQLAYNAGKADAKKS